MWDQGWRCSSEVELLLSMHKAPGSISNTTRKQNKKKKIWNQSRQSRARRLPCSPRQSRNLVLSVLLHPPLGCCPHSNVQSWWLTLFQIFQSKKWETEHELLICLFVYFWRTSPGSSICYFSEHPELIHRAMPKCKRLWEMCLAGKLCAQLKVRDFHQWKEEIKWILKD
jgi:hypothetical protein